MKSLPRQERVPGTPSHTSREWTDTTTAQDRPHSHPFRLRVVLRGFTSKYKVFAEPRTAKVRPSMLALLQRLRVRCAGLKEGPACRRNARCSKVHSTEATFGSRVPQVQRQKRHLNRNSCIEGLLSRNLFDATASNESISNHPACSIITIAPFIGHIFRPE